IRKAKSLSGPAVRDALAKVVMKNSLLPGGKIEFGPNGLIKGVYLFVQTTPGNTVRIVWPKKLPETRDPVLPMPRVQ
ncbi:MAG TPA: hypothetical protein VFW01_11020, partial [bacterium]|nr:hypothetical protein [bacterium]